MTDSGQAGISGPLAQDAGGFRFNSLNDALDFGRHSVERSNGILAANDINVAKGYVEGKAHIVLHCRADAEACEFDLVFRSVPTRISEHTASQQAGSGARKRCGSCADWDQHAMRVGVPYAVQSAEQPIPSLVWLEASKERTDFRRVSSKTFAHQFTEDAVGVPREWETGVLGITANQNDGGSVDGMVQRIAKIAGCVFDGDRHGTGDFRSKFYLVDILLCVTVEIDRSGVWLLIKKGFDLRGCLINVFPCAPDEQKRTIKRTVDHA